MVNVTGSYSRTPPRSPSRPRGNPPRGREGERWSRRRAPGHLHHRREAVGVERQTLDPRLRTGGRSPSTGAACPAASAADWRVRLQRAKSGPRNSPGAAIRLCGAANRSREWSSQPSSGARGERRSAHTCAPPRPGLRASTSQSRLREAARPCHSDIPTELPQNGPPTWRTPPSSSSTMVQSATAPLG